MQRIMIYYHSGAGSTKMVGEIVKAMLSKTFAVDIMRVEADYNYRAMDDYDFIVFGFPVFGFKISPSMSEFIDDMPEFEDPKPCYIYCTLGLAGGNALYSLAEKLHTKNMTVTGYEKVLSPGSDASLMFKGKWARSFKKKTPAKITNMVQTINNAMKGGITSSAPRFKYGWNILEKLLMGIVKKEEKKMMGSLRILTDKCTNCGLCITTCKRGCYTKGENYPLLDISNCEFCLGCVHHCPYNAITFLKDEIDKPRLNGQFFKTEKEKLLARLMVNEGDQ